MTYSTSTWRNAAAPIIARVIEQVGTDDMPARPWWATAGLNPWRQARGICSGPP